MVAGFLRTGLLRTGLLRARFLRTGCLGTRYLRTSRLGRSSAWLGSGGLGISRLRLGLLGLWAAGLLGLWAAGLLGASFLDQRPARIASITAGLACACAVDRATAHGGKHVQHAGQSCDYVDGRVPITARAAQRQRSERPVLLAPQQLEIFGNGFGESGHSLVAHPASDIDIGGEHHTRADGPEKFHVLVARRWRRARPQVYVDIGADRALHGHDGARFLDVEENELLTPSNTGHHAESYVEFGLGQGRTGEPGDQFFIVRSILVSLRLGPHLPQPPGLISLGPVDVEQGHCTYQCNRRQAEPHCRHREPP